MRTIKTYRKVGAFYIACEEDFSTSIRGNPSKSHLQNEIPDYRLIIHMKCRQARNRLVNSGGNEAEFLMKSASPALRSKVAVLQ